jgi:acyl-CoA reductase-like NAD-dependent aldehyde dehydrogenase
MDSATLGKELAGHERPKPAFLERPPKQLLIDGKWVPAASGATLETIDPTTEEVLTTFAAGDKADVDAAVVAARRALEQPSWSGMNPHERTRLLLRIADLIEAHADEFIMIEALDSGTPTSVAGYMVQVAVDSFRYYAGWPTKLHGETAPTDPSRFRYTRREPIGVCGQITPWNSPLDMAAWKLAPVLAFGNATVLKPAEQTPLSALRLGELLLEAGVPDGVVNIVTGLGETAGAAISGHPGIDKVAFTGSLEVGKLILAASAGNLKRVTLELGGKSPSIVFPDADMDAAVKTAATGFLLLTGQACIAGTRIFVQNQIADEFLERLTSEVASRVVGDPFAPGTELGPLNSREQYDRVEGYLNVGKDEGAVVNTGGGMLDRRGYFVQPTVFSEVTRDMRIAREEIFGPVAAVIPFEDVDDEIEVLRQANDTQYGLAAAVFTKDLARAHRVAHALQAGTVFVNTYGELDPVSPFGGYKQSGLGRELGEESLAAYTQTKTVVVALGEAAPPV